MSIPMAHHRLEQRCRQQDVDQHIVKMRNKTQPGEVYPACGRAFSPYCCRRVAASVPLIPSGELLHAGESLLDGALIIGRPRFICIHTLSLDF
ncbi:hypothetical protein LNP20_13850 [Klebsiella pneumoniae subsp. pneumoniae]|nr:hypothetical protein [Klebsiella pneumoniae subsp. pneumoniae]